MRCKDLYTALNWWVMALDTARMALSGRDARVYTCKRIPGT